MELNCLKALLKRISIVFGIVIVGFLSHRFFTSFDEDLIGALLFIIIFTLGFLWYYVNLFYKKQIHKFEFVISLIFVFLFTIIMFAFIYQEPMENDEEHSYFTVEGVEQQLSFEDALYFSTTTISTLGIGDILPHGDYRVFVMIEVIMGLVYMGLMVFFITETIEMEKKS